MHRRYFLAALAGAAISQKVRPAKGAIPIQRSELPKLWRLASQARNAREFAALAPASWGPAPWLFEGEIIYRDRPTRVRVKIGVAYDTVHDGLRAIAVPYAYRREDAAGWIEGTRHIIKGDVE
jgi:hypothetical protein